MREARLCDDTDSIQANDLRYRHGFDELPQGVKRTILSRIVRMFIYIYIQDLAAKDSVLNMLIGQDGRL